MRWTPETISNEIALSSSYCREAIADLNRAAQAIGNMDPIRTVVLPCNFGDRLWWCYDDGDDNDLPKVERSDPIKGFLIEPDGRISATYDFICYDRIGGPDLWLTEDQAKAEQARRLLKQNQTQAEEMKEEKTDGSL